MRKWDSREKLLKHIQSCKSESKQNKTDREGEGGNMLEAPEAKYVEKWMEKSKFEKWHRFMW